MRRFSATAIACAAAACALAGLAQASSVTELGYPTPFLQPDCPAPANCQAIAQVTGFQSQLGSFHDPFKVPKPGYIVAFTVRLAKPSADQVTYFKNTYGSTPSARIGIIKLKDRDKHAYKLYRQSQAFNLEAYFGSQPTIALKQPLRVNKGDIPALTVPTWLPAFAHNLPNDQAWRSSHASADCASPSPPAAAHQKVKTTVVYGCFYRTARLLYSVTFVPDPDKSNPTK